MVCDRVSLNTTIMKIENQVCNPEQCKDLEALGVKHDAPAYYWAWPGGIKWELFPQGYWMPQHADEGTDWIPAFTVAELGEALKWECLKPYQEAQAEEVSSIANRSDSQAVAYLVDSATEAQARAALLIYLLETGKTTAEEVNNRLISA